MSFDITHSLCLLIDEKERENAILTEKNRTLEIENEALKFQLQNLGQLNPVKIEANDLGESAMQYERIIEQLRQENYELSLYLGYYESAGYLQTPVSMDQQADEIPYEKDVHTVEEEETPYASDKEAKKSKKQKLWNFIAGASTSKND